MIMLTRSLPNRGCSLSHRFRPSDTPTLNGERQLNTNTFTSLRLILFTTCCDVLGAADQKEATVRGPHADASHLMFPLAARQLAQIGSTSCRERVCQYGSISGGGGSLKN